jgi:antitoxin YefM
MLTELKFTDARRELTSVFDLVQSLIPVIVQPRKKSEEQTFIFKEAIVHELLNEYKFVTTLIDEEVDSYSYWLDVLDMYGYGETKEEALHSLVEELIMYSKQYLENPNRYFNSSNRRHHLPYVLKVMICNDYDEVKQMLQRDAS